MSVLPLEQEIDYPTSDGQPMAETPEHQTVMIDLLHGLEGRYAAVSDVWVGSNFFLYYEKGNPKARVAPDVLLAKGVTQWKRPYYLLWDERPPSLVVEVTSQKTRRKDQGFKKSLYERLGVEEYVLFDPFEEYLRPRLQGYRLVRGRYQPIALEADGSLLSRTTGLRFKPEGERLRLVDIVTGEPLLWREEDRAVRVQESVARRAAQVRAAEESTLRQAAEERVAKEVAARQAAEERVAAESAARQAAEARAAEAAAARHETEERLRALEKELERFRQA